jgi:hypothetical protein
MRETWSIYWEGVIFEISDLYKLKLFFNNTITNQLMKSYKYVRIFLDSTNMITAHHRTRPPRNAVK